MEDFKFELANELAKKLKTGAIISFGNDIIHESPEEVLSIRLTDEDKTNIIPLSMLYQMKNNGLPLQRIADVIYNSIFLRRSIDTSKIVYQLISIAENEELLKNIPHIPFCDMAITFLYIINDEKKNCYFSITNDLMRRHNLTLQQLLCFAQENTFRLFPCTCSRFLTAPLQELLTAPSSEDQKLADPTIPDFVLQYMVPLYMVTCKDYSYGSIVLLNTAFLTEIADKLGTDLLLLPADHSAFALMPYPNDLDDSYIKNMVNEVLSDGKPILTRKIFLFRKENRSLGLFSKKEANENE